VEGECVCLRTDCECEGCKVVILNRDLIFHNAAKALNTIVWTLCLLRPCCIGDSIEALCACELNSSGESLFAGGSLAFNAERNGIVVALSGKPRNINVCVGICDHLAVRLLDSEVRVVCNYGVTQMDLGDCLLLPGGEGIGDIDLHTGT